MSLIGYRDRYVQRDHLECLTAALVARATHTTPPDTLARAYAEQGPLFSSMALACLAARGRDREVSPSDRGGVIRLALTTSDYPFAIANAAKAIAEPAYAHARAAYRLLGAARDLPNFRLTNLIRPAEFPLPLKVGEGGEVKFGAFTESGETGALATYASSIGLSYQLLVNDDANMFGGLATSAALRCVDLEDQLFFALLTSGSSSNGPTLRDGSQLFATSRGNLAASGAVISATTISAGRAAMMGATGPDGTKSVATPRYLVCPPSLLTLAETELAKLNPGADPSVRITPITSPNLSGTAWYLFADPAQLPAVAIHHLSGSPGPVIVAQSDWATEGVRLRVVLDFGVSALDPRGSWKNPGA